MTQSVLIDAREFNPGRRTGISRVLEGLTDSLAEVDSVKKITLAVSPECEIPCKLNSKRNISKTSIPSGFLQAERALCRLSKGNLDLFISPYPKLPLFGVSCHAVNTVHDILDLTHPAYRKRIRVFFDRFRLRTALKRASLTWYDSSWSLEETKRHVGLVGNNPRVRYPAVDEIFGPDAAEHDDAILEKHRLQAGFILAVSNGLQHKNLGVLVEIAPMLSRKMVFVGISENNRKYWQQDCHSVHTKWLTKVPDSELPALLRKSFCLAQPSTAEGYGYPPLEAMACGVPAVVSDIPVLLETTGGNALAVDPSHAKAWKEAFDALENKTTYRAQIEKGLRWVQRFSGRRGWDKHILDIEELLKGH